MLVTLVNVLKPKGQHELDRNQHSDHGIAARSSLQTRNFLSHEKDRSLFAKQIIAVCAHRYVITLALRSKYDVEGHYFRFAA